MQRFIAARFCLAVTVVLSAATAVRAGEPGDFTVVLLPDTQIYSESYPETYSAQTEWIRKQAQDENIRFVIHLGDIINRCDQDVQWQNADRAHRLLDGTVPYSIAPGNHDLPEAREQRALLSTPYDKYFPPSRFDGCAWYGGHFGEGNRSNYCFFQENARRFLVVSLEFSPSDKVLQWAGRVIENHPEHQVIVATHCYMRPQGRDTECGNYEGFVGNCGEAIWQKLIRKHESIFLVVSGHVLGTGHQVSTNDAGRPVHEILVDYQGLPNGGDGWLTLLRFKPSHDRIDVQTYSPVLKRFSTAPGDAYTMSFQMPVAASQ